MEIRIADKQPGLHTYGIEFNFDKKNWEKDASIFIFACRKVLDKRYGWFHQCGAHTKTGYQFFEMLNSVDQDILLSEAQKVADEIGAELVL